MIVPDQIHRAAKCYGEQVAVICDEEQRTFAQLEERSNRLANALMARGLRPGDRVACLLENSIECIEADFALAKAGLVRVSLNPRLTLRECEWVLSDSEPKIMIYGANFEELVRQLSAPPELWRVRMRGTPEAHAGGNGAVDYEDAIARASAEAPAPSIDPEHLYCLFYTSGTTGKPKGVMLSHRAILQVTYNLLMELGPIRPGEKILLIQPLSHGSGFFVLPYFVSGGTVVIQRRFDAIGTLELLRRWRIETLKLIPTMLQRILQLPDVERFELPHLQRIVSGASAMPTEVLRSCIRRFGPRKLVQVYGQAEAPVTLCILPPEDHVLDGPHPERLRSAGRPWRSVLVRVVDEEGCPVPEGEVGEVVVRGPHMMLGYWRRPDLTQAVLRDGWLHTRDLGYMDRFGYVYLVGRKDEMIKSGGFLVSPLEVENVLYEHPDVVEAAVVGVPDEEWGQMVVAFVVLKPNASATAESLIDFTRPVLGFKRPKKLIIVDELPKNPNGKIQKSALLQRVR